jgi:hypothetical protein
MIQVKLQAQLTNQITSKQEHLQVQRSKAEKSGMED